MAKFAQYFIRYTHEFAPYEWEKRQQHLGALFEKNESIGFYSEKDGNRKMLKHKVYHLNCAPQIFVIRLANNIDLNVELDFEPATAKDEPSCFIIIDNRERLRTVAIQKRRQTRWNSTQVAKILTDSISAELNRKYCYGFEILPEYYPEDLYKVWEKKQQHAAQLRFGVPDMSEEEIRAKVLELKSRERDYRLDDSLMEPLIQMALEARKAKYKYIYTVMPEDRKTPLYVDKTSKYVCNLITMADALDEPVELVTSDGTTFRCYVDSDEDNTKKIACCDFNVEHLEMLFRERDKEGNKIEPDDRKAAEGETLEMMNRIKHEATDKEEEDAA